MATISRNQSDLMNNSILKRVWLWGGCFLEAGLPFVCVCARAYMWEKQRGGLSHSTASTNWLQIRLLRRGGEKGVRRREMETAWREGRGGRKEEEEGLRKTEERDEGKPRRAESFHTSELGGTKTSVCVFQICTKCSLMQSEVHKKTSETQASDKTRHGWSWTVAQTITNTAVQKRMWTLQVQEEARETARRGHNPNNNNLACAFVCLCVHILKLTVCCVARSTELLWGSVEF